MQKWWPLVVLFLTLWLCVIVTTAAFVLANRADGKLYRYPRCVDFRDPVWQIHDGAGHYFEGYVIMSQKQHIEYEYSCTFAPD